MKRILITGGAGLVGKYVTNDLATDYEVTVLDKKKPAADVEFIEADLTDASSIKAHDEHFDAILHLAGIPHPLNDPAERVFTVNTLGTFTVMQFAADKGIKKVVLASSESTLGFAFARRAASPDYFPIDEQHPLLPQDPYGLSKVCSEEILKSYSRAYQIQTVALRFPWIWVPDEKEKEVYRKLISEYEKWYKNLWAWVNVHDVSQAFSKALEYKGDGFDRFFITADDNWTGLSSAELIGEFYPKSQVVHSMKSPRSLISSDLAKVVLKYSPKFTVSETIK
ncbi:MAG TPA: NAD(P)-dependent oxidoreductase [Candidatus Kryptonia bacterium]